MIGDRGIQICRTDFRSVKKYFVKSGTANVRTNTGNAFLQIQFFAKQRRSARSLRRHRRPTAFPVFCAQQSELKIPDFAVRRLFARIGNHFPPAARSRRQRFTAVRYVKCGRSYNAAIPHIASLAQYLFFRRCDQHAIRRLHGAVRREFPKQARMRIRNADRIGAVFAFNFRDFKHKTNL